MTLLTTPELSALSEVRHGFSTREGGVSTGPLSSLNLGHRENELPEALTENWRRVLGWLDPTLRLEDLALLEQVHEAVVLEVKSGLGPLVVVGVGDGVITSTPGVVLGIRTADCVPVLLAAPGAVGAAHAGWRGVAASVVPQTVHRLCELAGCGPAQIVAGIGPHISVDAYEVGAEVVTGIAGSGVPEAVFVQGSNVNLRAAVSWQLASLGLGRVGHVRRCTVSDPALFSHRGEGVATGRLGAVIARVL